MSVALYAVPTWPFGSEVVAMTRGLDPPVLVLVLDPQPRRNSTGAARMQSSGTDRQMPMKQEPVKENIGNQELVIGAHKLLLLTSFKENGTADNTRTRREFP
jgi:hypothetical protein